MASAITRNQTAAKDFLARNGHEKGVMTTASGLEYKVISAGDRKAPAVAPTDPVTVQVSGQTARRHWNSTAPALARAPASFTVNGVIPGWQEALVLMKPGAKWQLFVPPNSPTAPGRSPAFPADRC